jgi:crotonobetainyl-CoA:carnitine CoA-transferase CaiB-like acyl-CoA transferase
MTANRPLPLAGSVVIDLSDECLSLAGRLLADLGATVVRVEAAGGDALRTSGPRLTGSDGVEGSLRHLLYNAGKLSLALNLASPMAWDLVDRLLVRADLVLAPLQKSPEARRFLESERLGEVHPHLGLVDVVLRRGASDPVPSDLVGVAAGGLLYGLGYPGVAPDYPAGRLAYKQASLVGAAVAIAMLFEATKGARGSHACISLQEAIASTTIHFANQNLWRLLGTKVQRLGGRIATLYQAADGRWVTFGITPNTPQRWSTFAAWLAEAVGYHGLVGAEFPGDVYAPEYGGETHTALTTLCTSLPSDELAAQGQARGLLVVPVNTVDAIVGDDHLLARGCFVPVPHPALGRTIRLPRLPIRSSAYEPVPRPAPTLGQHSAAVLRGLADVECGEFSALRAGGTVSGPDGDDSIPAEPIAAPPSRQRTSRRRLTRDSLPLAGVRVVDFTWMAAGPLVTEVLANLGADVIKVESEARLDTLRTAVHAVPNPTIETSAFFQDCNTDKRSITVNLGSPDGIRLALELVRGADVVTENFTSGVVDRLGLGYEAMRAVKPDIVMASFPVMGSFGPKATWRGIGNSVVAMCGLAGHTGAPDRKPTGVQLHTDFTLAPLGAMAILAALIQRDRTGCGQYIEVAQYEAGIHLLDTELIEYLANGVTPERRGNRSREMAPHGLFPCAGDDRWVAIAARDTVDWLEICRAMGNAALLQRRDLRTLAGRQAAEDEIEEAISAWTRGRDAWDVADALQRAGVPAGPVEDIEDLLERDPSMAGFFMEFAHPVGVPFLAQNQPFLWNGQRLPIRRAPFFGEHNDAVFRDELSLDEEEIARLVTEQAIH